MRRRSKLVIQDLHYDPVERPTSAMRRKEYLDTMCFDYTSQRAVTATDEAHNAGVSSTYQGNHNQNKSQTSQTEESSRCRTGIEGEMSDCIAGVWESGV